MPETASAPPQAVAAPRPLSPTEGERVDATTIPFSWRGVPGAEDYVLQVASDAAFEEPLVTLNTGPTTAVTLYDSLPVEAEQEAFWRVRTSADKAWGPTGRFTAMNGEAVRAYHAELDAEAHQPPPVHPEWEARREEAVAAMALDDHEVISNTQVALVLGVLVVSFVLLMIVLLLVGQVTYQGEVFPN